MQGFLLACAGTKLMAIAAGAQHSLAVSVEGEVFTWGSGHRGCLGKMRRRRLCTCLAWQCRSYAELTGCCLPALCILTGHGRSLLRGYVNERSPRLVSKLRGIAVQSAAGGLMASGAAAAVMSQLLLDNMWRTPGSRRLML